MRNFRNYEVWQNGIQLVNKVYKLTNSFPDSEKFGLTSQIRRSAVSIPSNIAEGASRTSEKEFKRFLEISLGSSFELETQFIIAEMTGFIQKPELNETLSQLTSIQKQLNSLRNKLC